MEESVLLAASDAEVSDTDDEVEMDPQAVTENARAAAIRIAVSFLYIKSSSLLEAVTPGRAYGPTLWYYDRFRGICHPAMLQFTRNRNACEL